MSKELLQIFKNFFKHRASMPLWVAILLWYIVFINGLANILEWVTK